MNLEIDLSCLFFSYFLRGGGDRVSLFLSWNKRSENGYFVMMVVVDISDLSFFVCRRRGLTNETLETSTTRPKQKRKLLIYVLCDGHFLGYSQGTEELVGFPQ